MSETMFGVLIGAVLSLAGITITILVYLYTRRGNTKDATLAREDANIRQDGIERREAKIKEKEKHDKKWEEAIQPLLDELDSISGEIDKKDLLDLSPELKTEFTKPILPLLDEENRSAFEDACAEYGAVYVAFTDRDHSTKRDEFGDLSDFTTELTEQGVADMRGAVEAVRGLLIK